MSTMTLKGAKGEGDFFRLRFWGAVLLVLGALLALGAFPAHAAPLAGTSIGNQASASYRDNNNVDRITVSNSVQTIVQAIGSATMTQSQTKVGAPGQTIAFAHTIVNTGNSTDTFAVSLGAQVNNTGTAFATAGTGVYADANCDGQADNNTVVNSLGPVAPGGQVCFVAQVTLNTTAGDDSQFPINFNSSIAGATLTGNPNTDRVSISNNAVISLTKSISTSTGPSGTIVTYQIFYRNTGTVSAGNVVIADQLPSGAAYVPGSGRWSAATGTNMTDAATDTDAGSAGVAPYRIDYASTGAGVTAAIIAIIERIDPGVQGYVQFQATMTGNGPLTINNTAQACYSDVGTGGTVVPPASALPAGNCASLRATAQWNGAAALGAGLNTELTNITAAANTLRSNTVPFFIPQVGATGVARITDNNANTDGSNPGTAAAAALLADNNTDVAVATAGQGTLATWDTFVFNAGTGTDTFNITVATTGAATNFPAGTTFLLLRSDGFTPLTDSNNDGVLDTGPVAVNTNYLVRVVAVLPPGAAAGKWEAIVGAQSTNTSSSTNTVAVRAYIIGSRVDLTNANGNGGTQQAAGEGTPQTTVAVNPGSVATFGLVVNNTGSVPDSFDLSYNLAAGAYSGTTPFAFNTPSQLGNGFALAFYVDTGTTCATNQLGAPVSNTGVISPGSLRRICALVSVPTNAPAGNTDIYFRVLSPTTFSGNFTTSSGDVKFDRLTVNIFRSIAITPNNSGQIFPGGSIQYCHTVTNGGNVAETLTVTQSNQTLFGTGTWAQFATVYADTNKNCVLDGTENTVPLTSTVVNAQAYAVGASTNFIVVVQAPGSASAGQTNVNTFTLSSVSGAGGSLVATDTTSVVIGQINLVKDQVLDTTGTACTQTFTQVALDALTTWQLTPLTTGAIPGACVIYRVRATNVGTQNVTSVVINDVAPPNTTLHTGAVSSASNACTPGGASPNVTCSIATLGPSNTTTMYFRVKIDP